MFRFSKIAKRAKFLHLTLQRVGRCRSLNVKGFLPFFWNGRLHNRFATQGKIIAYIFFCFFAEVGTAVFSRRAIAVCAIQTLCVKRCHAILC